MSTDRASLIIKVLLIVLLGVPAFGDETVADVKASDAGPPEMASAARDYWNSEAPVELGRWLSQRLEGQADPPEWLAMLVDILQGSQLGPDEGWFRSAVAQSRYDWRTIQLRFDSDGDSRISRTEFPGLDNDFDRLDRDRDGLLTANDFQWPSHALAATPGALFFYRADTDGDGKVSPEEFQAFFERTAADNLGFLTLDDFRTAFDPPPSPPRPQGGDASAVSSGPDRATLVKGLFQQEIGSLKSGPAAGDLAPDFTLRTVEGDQEITLSDRIGSKPVVLVFGNFTCGPFRSQAGNVEKLFRRYRDRAEFLMIYVREAHPTDGWVMGSNEHLGVSIRQPRTDAERVEVAQVCQNVLEFKMPFLVDSIDDHVGATYSGMPSRLYLIDGQGRIVYKSGRGPFGFKPGELEQALILLLCDQEADGQN